MSATVLYGDCRDILPTLDAGSVQTCVTSPPYFGLRDYGVSGQIGLESTPDAYVAEMVAVFRAVKRVLRDDGTLWLNLGDSFSGHTPVGFRPGNEAKNGGASNKNGVGRVEGLKAKDLIGIPWRVAFALQQPYEVVTIKGRTDRAWLAALIDGEGCITTTMAQPTTGKNESYAIVVQVRMSDRECLDRIVAITGMSHVQAEALSPSMANGNQRPASCWKIAGENAATVLAEIYPYLLIKKRQALVAWNLQRLKDGITTKRGIAIPAENMEMRRELHRVIRALNQRESVDVPGWCREPEYTVEPGWYLRSDVIWHKPNPMPESVTDRPTKAHEYLFLLAKSERYFYDADAIAEPYANGPDWIGRAPTLALKENDDRGDGGGRATTGNPLGRNRRSVWTVATQPFKGAHFATFPPALIEPCILAGSKRGDTVLDPFGGAGTTGLVADRLGRNAVLCELNPAYAEMARRRITDDAPLFADGAA